MGPTTINGIPAHPLWVHVVVVPALLVGVGAVVEVYRIGDSGAEAVWQSR